MTEQIVSNIVQEVIQSVETVEEILSQVNQVETVESITEADTVSETTVVETITEQVQVEEIIDEVNQVETIEEREVLNLTIQTLYIDDIYTAGEIIGTHKVVYVANDGKVYKASSSDTTQAGRILGVTTQSVVADAAVYVRWAGRLTLAAWGLTPGTVYFLGENGEITNSVPAGLVQQIGVAKSSTELEINIYNTIVRSA